jgi:O-antigen/teichoic acid export membrane protein
MMVLILCFALNLPVSIIQRVLIGKQRGYLVNGIQSITNLLSFVLLLVAIHLKAGLVILVFCVAGTPALVMASVFSLYMLNAQKELRPSISHWSLTTSWQMLKLGSGFLVQQIFLAWGYSADAFIVTHSVGTASVPLYTVTMRPFMFVSGMVGGASANLWPAYAEAASRGDYLWVRSTFVGALGKSVKGVAAVFGLGAIAAPLIVKMWTSNRIQPDLVLCCGCACWALMDVVRAQIGNLFGGLQRLREVTTWLFVYGLSSSFAQFFCGLRWGVHGVVWAGVFCSCFLFILPLLIASRKFLMTRSDVSS